MSQIMDVGLKARVRLYHLTMDGRAAETLGSLNPEAVEE